MFSCEEKKREQLKGHTLLVQGVIDCAVETDGAWTVIDYKTDGVTAEEVAAQTPEEESIQPEKLTEEAVAAKLQEAKKVIIVPGYGMALSQAQANVARLASALEKKGADVKFAIHPVAGRMPGHMSVLLCEADIDYEKLFMMEDINEEFASCDIAIVIGANDVTNPAANTAEGTPIYGMPVLDVEKAPRIVFCNFDTSPVMPVFPILCMKQIMYC